MEVGDLVRVKKGCVHHGNYKLGVITRIDLNISKEHCWVRWVEWLENDKWMGIRTLEIVEGSTNLKKINKKT